VVASSGGKKFLLMAMRFRGAYPGGGVGVTPHF